MSTRHSEHESIILGEEPSKKLLSSTGEIKPPPRWYFPKRYILVCMCFIGMIVCYADRTNFSVSIIPMRKEFNWDKTTEGFILSAFWYGYALTQVPGGWLSDRYSGKTVLSVAVICWSVATILTPVAAKAGLAPLIIIRLLLGKI
jgi:ACS family sodium-dependent inorganic phosphate cotransporter